MVVRTPQACIRHHESEVRRLHKNPGTLQTAVHWGEHTPVRYRSENEIIVIFNKLVTLPLLGWLIGMGILKPSQCQLGRQACSYSIFALTSAYLIGKLGGVMTFESMVSTNVF